MELLVTPAREELETTREEEEEDDTGEREEEEDDELLRRELLLRPAADEEEEDVPNPAAVGMTVPRPPFPPVDELPMLDPAAPENTHQ